MHPKNRTAKTNRSFYNYEVRTDSVGNDVRVGDIVELTGHSIETTLGGRYAKIITLYEKDAGVSIFRPSDYTSMLINIPERIPLSRLIKVENLANLTAYLLTL